MQYGGFTLEEVVVYKIHSRRIGRSCGFAPEEVVVVTDLLQKK